MNVDKWFFGLSKLWQIILVIIPVVGWVIEILVRLSVALREGDVLNWVVFLVFVILGAAWILEIIDVVYKLIVGHFILLAK